MIIDSLPLKQLILSNIEALCSFIKKLAQNESAINAQHLYKVQQKSGNFKIIKCNDREQVRRHNILLGGEVSNSFCPLYEISYIIKGVFLAGVGTAFLQKNKTNLPILSENISLNFIKTSLLDLSEAEVYTGIINPSISLICSLDTDIEPYRYFKHQLWRLDETSFRKRCSEYTKDDLGVSPLNLALKDVYWIDEDRYIAEAAIQYAENLAHAKALQYYITIKIILDQIGIPIGNIPIYFNFEPKEEILSLGSQHEFLSLLIALHQKDAIKFLSNLTHSRKPWILAFSCPKCGESSKKIIRASILRDYQTIRLVCSKSDKVFRNELGDNITRSGCGHSWLMPVPDNSKDLYEILSNSSFTINFCVRSLMRMLTNSAFSPICFPSSDIGVTKEDGIYKSLPNLPKGYGDHRLLITSMLAMQKLFIRSIIAPEISQQLKIDHHLASKELQFLTCISEQKLFDKHLRCRDNQSIFVTDTSVLKILKDGVSLEELFIRSISFSEVTLEDLLHLRNTDMKTYAGL